MRHVTAQQLSAFLDGALTGVSRDLVTRHLADCADCRERHALWHIYDEVLHRVLSWEPNEYTMEEASARVELALTAERRGLQPPEFVSALEIAPTPNPAASPRASSTFPALPPLDPPPAQAATPPAPTARVAPAISPPPPAPATTPPAPPSPAPPPTPFETAPPPPAPVASPPAPALPIDPDRYSPAQASAWTPPVYAPPVAAPQYPSAPPRGYSPPISVYEDLRPRPEPQGIPWASLSLPRPRRRLRGVLLTCVALAALALLAMPFMPEVIRIQVPESWGTFARHDGPGGTPALDSGQPLAERTSSAPPPEPYRALPAPVESVAARPAASDTPVTVTAPAPPPPETAKPRPHATAKSPRRPIPRREEQQEPEVETTTGAENSMTFIPVQVKTEVHLSSTQPRHTAAAPAAPDTVADQALPLLCGEVLDESGAPIEGARVRLTAPPLTVRTDKRGHFCVACPAGERTFLVDAEGYAAVTRGVELTDGTFETHITLAATH